MLILIGMEIQYFSSSCIIGRLIVQDDEDDNKKTTTAFHEKTDRGKWQKL